MTKVKEKGILPVLLAVTVSFLLAIVVSIYSLALLARENTKEIDTMLTYRIYDSISSSLNEPIIVARTMSCDDFLTEFLKNEDAYGEEEAITVMQNYLSSLRAGLEYDSAFLVSEKSRRYYTYEGLNKIVDPEHDTHDVWYSLFLEQNNTYDLDVDSDEMNQGQWTVFVNARIEDENGTLLGVCGVGVQMTNLQELFGECEKEYNVKINLVDKNGLVQVDTNDINIENAWLDEEVISRSETDEYVYSTMGDNEFVVTKYVEHLGWYLAVSSAPTAISRDFVNVILLNIGLFLFVMGILIFTVTVILRRSKRERDNREQLLIKSERAVAASEAKSSFLSNMSHEIRTPINAVLGMNEMILRRSSDEEILEYATNIQSAGKTLLYLINSILDFSKIEEGKMEITPVVYDTGALINNLVLSVRERAREKGIDFIVNADENLPARLIGDDMRLSQVIMNILTNAVKYTEKGYVRFIFRQEARNENAIDLFVSVEDTGLGIKEEDFPKLFESFERLDEEKNHGIEGTGLGMAIVISLLKMMGSEIQVKSEYGKGSTFYFTIRQEIDDASPMGDYRKSAKGDRKKSAKESLLAPEARILVVDDNEMNLKVAKKLLHLFDIDADTSGSGRDAVRRLKEGRYHMVLLDHMMPEMDGIETLGVMKKEGLTHEEMPVIALTANAVNGAKERYIEAGFQDYLSKPIELEELKDTLIKWLPADLLTDAAKESAPADNGVIEFVPDGEASEIRQEEPAFDDAGAKAMAEELAASGIDVEQGLAFCGGEMEFYAETVNDFAGFYEEKKADLERTAATENWQEFEIRVHALKSASKTMGAVTLSEMAKSLEEAAGKGDLSYIRSEYPKLMEEYERVVQCIRNVKMKRDNRGDENK